MTTNSSSTNNQPLNYKDSGVDIDAGNNLVEKIKPLAAATKRSGVMSGLGGFGALFDVKAAGFVDPILVSATDGVGTKLKLAEMVGNHTGVGVDLVAMCVNDLVVQGAEPLFFLDYFACGKLDVEQARAVIAGIAKGCSLSGCALVGGETAEMPGMYKAGEYDLAGFSVGAAERGSLLPRDDIGAGDVLLGLASSGVHSNGFSLVRRIVERSGASLAEKCAFDERKLGDVLLEPTRIYVKSCLSAIRKTGGVKALAHITGGGLTENLPRVLPAGLQAQIDLSSWSLPPIFAWLQAQGGLDASEMLRTFNCGVGMILVCSPDKLEEVRQILQAEGEQVFVMGVLAEKAGAAVVYSGDLS